jgi:protein TonB
MGFTRRAESFALTPTSTAHSKAQIENHNLPLSHPGAPFTSLSGVFEAYYPVHRRTYTDAQTLMSELRTIVPKPEDTLVALPRHTPVGAGEDLRQRRLMVGSLCLLLLALSIVLWRDRDFWFPDSPEETDIDQPVENSPAAKTVPGRQSAPVAKLAPATKANHKGVHSPVKKETASTTAPPAAPPASPVIARTVLPPLEVEVVAGDNHRMIRPGSSSSVRVDLQPGSPPQTAPEAPTTRDTEIAANLTSNAAERVQMSSDTSSIVTRSVRPNYPLLARQMKVQGSVILQALIGKDGIIQNLRVVSGPHILASAAQDAVRQWHFKPHLEGAEPVETEAKITVNFTISTN